MAFFGKLYSIVNIEFSHRQFGKKLSKCNNGSLLPKLFWPNVRKKCSCDREKLLKFEAEGQEFAKCLRSLKVS